MIDILAPLSHYLDGLSLALQPAQRSILMRSIATQLRINHRNRIRRNIDPAGTRYTPRKREQIKSIRRGLMFKKLGKSLAIESSPNHLAVGFAGKLGEKMKTHQYGLTQKPTPRSKPYHYPLRELEGFSVEDIAMIQTEIITYLESCSR